MLVTDINSPTERERIQQLIAMVPSGLSTALDVGTADCHIAIRLADSIECVTAIDLEEPVTSDPRIQIAKGDVTSLDFPDAAFDLVVCSEVLEHVHPRFLQTACDELSRVAARFVLIAVPYDQDIRVGRTRCRACGGRNSPYGHVNTFYEGRLEELFPKLVPLQSAKVGAIAYNKTSLVSAWLMDLAGNPYGTYTQQQPCMYCGAKLVRPSHMPIVAKVAAKAAVILNRFQGAFRRRQANWLQILFEQPAK